MILFLVRHTGLSVVDFIWNIQEVDWYQMRLLRINNQQQKKTIENNTKQLYDVLIGWLVAIYVD